MKQKKIIIMVITLKYNKKKTCLGYIYIYVCMHKVVLIYFFPELISVNKFNIMKIEKKINSDYVIKKIKGNINLIYLIGK